MRVSSLNRIALASLAVVLGSSAPAHAVISFTPTDLSAMTNDSVKALVQTVGIGADHRAYMPATPLGILIGVDVGADATYLAFPQEFVSAMSVATSQGATQVPAGIPLPKLNIHKGLPMNLDLGMSFMYVPNNGGGDPIYTSYAGEAKWAFLSGAAMPSGAVRFSAAYNDLYFIKSTTYALDLTFSKNLMVIDPYIGGGYQFWNGEVSVPTGVPQLPTSISAAQSGYSPRIYGGMMLKLGVMKITAQADYSRSGISTLGGKLSFGF